MIDRTVPMPGARLAGLLYLGTIAGGIFAEVVVRGSLIVRGDATATAAAIIGQQAFFRTSMLGDLAMLACYVGVTTLFYDLFATVSRRVSLMAAAFSVTGIAILASAAFFTLAALHMLAAPPFLAAAIDASQREAMALFFLKLHGDGYVLSLVFFGIYCLMIGWLAWRSDFLPRIVGALMLLAGGCYLLKSVADLAAPTLAAALPSSVMIPTLVGEAALALWLLAFGGHRRRA